MSFSLSLLHSITLWPTWASRNCGAINFHSARLGRSCRIHSYGPCTLALLIIILKSLSPALTLSLGPIKAVHRILWWRLVSQLDYIFPLLGAPCHSVLCYSTLSVESTLQYNFFFFGSRTVVTPGHGSLLSLPMCTQLPQASRAPFIGQTHTFCCLPASVKPRCAVCCHIQMISQPCLMRDTLRTEHRVCSTWPTVRAPCTFLFQQHQTAGNCFLQFVALLGWSCKWGAVPSLARWLIDHVYSTVLFVCCLSRAL